MKPVILTMILCWSFSFKPVFVFSQEESTTLTKEELAANAEKLSSDVRGLIDQNQYKNAFFKLYNDMKSNKVVNTWNLYVILAETARISGNMGTVIRMIPNQGRLKVFRKSLDIWVAGDAVRAAKLLATISEADPSLQYLVGKLYLSAGQLYQGAGYLSLGADMSIFPYGAYYAGLGQNAVGNFSKAYRFLSQAKNMLLESESEILLDVQIQMSIAEFGEENYSHAYELIMPVYEKRPIEVLKLMDPGLILTGMKKNTEAKNFWEKALKQKLPYAVSTQIKKNLNYNKRLVDSNYPPAWMRR